MLRHPGARRRRPATGASAGGYPGRMTGTVPSADASASSPAQPELDDASRRNALAVLGMLAYLELSGFSRLAADAAGAPALPRRIRLARTAGATLDRFERVTARVAELGADLEETMEPFAGVLVEFDARTEPSTWTERLLKSYVGYGVADDFCRLLGRALDPTTSALVADALTDEGHVDLVLETLGDACAQDSTLAARLALWGRRLVGEALTVVQRVLADQPALRDLLVQVDDAPVGEAQQRLFTTLTAEHARRMERLGLTP